MRTGCSRSRSRLRNCSIIIFARYYSQNRGGIKNNIRGDSSQLFRRAELALLPSTLAPGMLCVAPPFPVVRAVPRMGSGVAGYALRLAASPGRSGCPPGWTVGFFPRKFTAGHGGRACVFVALSMGGDVGVALFLIHKRVIGFLGVYRISNELYRIFFGKFSLLSNSEVCLRCGFVKSVRLESSLYIVHQSLN